MKRKESFFRDSAWSDSGPLNAADAVDFVFEAIVKALAQYESVTILDSGRSTTRKQSSCAGRIPHAGEMMETPVAIKGNVAAKTRLLMHWTPGAIVRGGNSEDRRESFRAAA